MKWREELRLHGMEGGRLHGMERGRLQWSGGKKVAQKRVEMEKNKNCAKIVISVVEPGSLRQFFVVLTHKKNICTTF